MDIFSQAMIDMKYVMHKGGGADLNLYVSNLNNGGIIGCAAVKHRGRMLLKGQRSEPPCFAAASSQGCSWMPCLIQPDSAAASARVSPQNYAAGCPPTRGAAASAM